MIAVYALLGAAVTVSACCAAGRLLLRALRIHLYRGEQRLFAFLGGAACVSLLVFAMAAVHAARKGVFLCVAVVLVASALRLRSLPRKPLPPLPRLWRVGFGTIFAAFTLLYLVNAMAPEMSPDGSSYHLGWVLRYARAHGLLRVSTNMYANLSQGLEMLFLMAFSFGRHSAAALVHFAFLAALPWLMLCYASRFGMARAGVFGAVLAYCSPVIGVDGVSAYNDVAAAAIAFAVFYLIQIWDETRCAKLLILVGLLSGFGYAVKYTAGVSAVYAAGFVLWRSRHRLKDAGIVALCAAPIAAPWLVKNWLWLGNPFSPFFNAVFPNPYVTVSFEQEYGQLMRYFNGLESRWQIPLEATARGGMLGGLLGPVFLLAPLGLAALGRRQGRRLLFAAALFGAAIFANAGTRFLVPAAPFAALAMGMALERVPWMLAMVAALHAVLSWPAVLPRYAAPYAWRLRDVPVRAALRLKGEPEFLAERLPRYAAARMLESRVPAGERVFALSEIPIAYTTREVVNDYQSAFGNVLKEIVWAPLSEGLQATRAVRVRLAPTVCRRIRLVYTGPRMPERWCVSELRFYAGGRELVREPGWRLRARPNPWDVQMAFDNSDVTRWCTAEPRAGGMYLEADFRAPRQVDEVLVVATPEQFADAVAVETESGRHTGSVRAEAVPARPHLRRAATLELKARGMGWLLIDDDAFGAADIRSLAPLWGLDPADAAGTTRLYRIR